MIFSIERTVSPHDLDINNIVSPSGALRFMQEAAYMHMAAFPPSMDELRKENKVFIISRVAMSLYTPLHACDNIKISTWACESKGYSFQRCSRIERDGKIVAEMESVSALLDPVNRKFWKVTDYPQSYSNEAPTELDLPARFRIPEETELKLAGEHNVTYYDCDLNMHVNNTHYPDLICGFLPQMKDRRPIKFTVSYVSEAPIGDTLKVYTSKEDDDGVIWVRTVRQDGQTNVECRIVVDGI